MKRWSKLQKKFYSIIDEKLDLQLHLSIYRMKTRWGSTDLPRYWLTLGKDIIFDYPKQFMDEYIPSMCINFCKFKNEHLVFCIIR